VFINQLYTIDLKETFADDEGDPVQILYFYKMLPNGPTISIPNHIFTIYNFNQLRIQPFIESDLGTYQIDIFITDSLESSVSSLKLTVLPIPEVKM
jgi:hypothetical protein